MDGKTLLIQLRELMGEQSDSTWMTDRLSYDLLYEAAIKTHAKLNIPTTTQSVSTTASTTSYNLNADFLKLYMIDDTNRFFLKYVVGASTYWIYWKHYDSMVLGNRTTDVLIPDSFTIKDRTALSRVTGTASADGTASAGESTLTDADVATPFSTVVAGDIVHNTTDGSSGIVISKTSDTALVTALFGGTNNDWTTSDIYYITPQFRFSLVLDPPPSTSSHTITVPYVQMPTPVYSPYRSYNLPATLQLALPKYAAWLYRYRDREPNFGDAYYLAWDRAVRDSAEGLDSGLNRKGFRVNMKKRAQRSGSFR